MKATITLALLILSTLSFAQGTLPRTMEFWDGTFAYNKLIVKEHQFQSNIVTLELSGATLGLGDQMEGIGKTWGLGDKVLVTVRKDDCQIDFEKRAIDCAVKKASGTVSWTLNHRVSKSIKSLLENIKVHARGEQFSSKVMFEFSVPSDEFFTAANDTILIDFRNLDF